MTNKQAPAADGTEDFFRALDTQLLVHELKNPLSLIEATTRTLIEQSARLGPLTERQEKALRRILRGAMRGRRLVNQLLEIGRAGAEQFFLTSFDPAESVRRVLLEAVESSNAELSARLISSTSADEQLAEIAKAGITIRKSAGIDELRVFQDPDKFELIVSNLIQNGLRFRRQSLEVALSREGDNLVVLVQDDGPGIAPQYHATVFERYKQLPTHDGGERKGHGLGLAGALILARRLGGNITLESVMGRGATFRLTIPCQRARTEST